MLDHIDSVSPQTFLSKLHFVSDMGSLGAQWAGVLRIDFGNGKSLCVVCIFP